MPIKLDPANIRKSINAFKKQTNEIGLIINPIINNYRLKEKEKLEVCQIGKFLYNINPNLRILEKPAPPNPDFILNFEGKIIGLEHTRIINALKTQKFFSISKLFDDAAIEFKTTNPEAKICATFRLNYNLTFKQQDKNNLIKTISSFVSEAIKGNFENQPDFINEINIFPNTIVSFKYLEGDFTSSYLTITDLQKAISAKEKKLQKYYSQSNLINEFWLVLMIGSLNSASFKINENENYKTKSIFDKVFLMSDFSENIIEIQ